MASSYRSKESERPHSCISFLYVHDKLCAKLCRKRRLRIQDRSTGCVLSCTDSSKQQKVPQVRLRKQGVPVSSTTVRSKHSPSSFYSFGAYGDSIPAPSGDLSDTISGRLVDSPPGLSSFITTSGVGCPHGGFLTDPYRPQAPHQLSGGVQSGYFCPTALGSSASGPPGYDRHGQFDSSFIYQQAGRDSLPHLAVLNCRSFPLVRVSEHNSPGKTHSRLSERDSRPPISSEPANTDRVVPTPRYREPYLQALGTPEIDMFATLSNSHLPRFMSPVPEPRALAVDALSQDWQGRSMYMFPPFPLLSKVMQKLRSTQVAEVILVAPWWPSQSWFPHLLRLCVEHPLVLPYRRNLLSQQDQKYISDRKSYHLHVWRLSCDTTKQQAFQTRSLGSRQPLGGPQPIACTMIDGFCFDRWAAGQGFDPLDPTASQIASFLFDLFETHGLSPQTIKGYRTCIGSVLNRTGRARVVLHRTISDMIASMELQRPRITPVLPQWDLGVVLEALSKSPYEPLREASFKHLTLKTVFLLAMASAGRRSELHALRFDQNYIQFKPKGAGVTLYFSPEFMRKNQKPNQVNDPWYIPAIPTGKPEFGAPNCPVRALHYYDHRYLTEHPELRKDRRRLFVPIKDNNAGKELSASSISRWICTTIVDSHDAIQDSKKLSGSVKAHEVRAVATSLQLFNKVDLHSVMKAGRWSSGGTFTSFYFRDLCPQAESLQRAGPIVAAGDIVRISSS